MKHKILSGNALKMIAAISMLIDHIGLLFFPFNGIFRIFGRLAFPIFAYMIAEGAKYTRNKKKHFFTTKNYTSITPSEFKARVYAMYFSLFDIPLVMTTTEENSNPLLS